MRKHRTAAVAAAVLLFVLTGCSADDAARSQLSQTAKETASASRSAALALGQHEKDRITQPVLDTALGDIAQKLGQGAASLSQVTAAGGIAMERDHILAVVRSAQDTLMSAQAALAVGKGDGDSLDAQRAALDAAAKALQSASKKVGGE
jgi:hypothetical protein